MAVERTGTLVVGAGQAGIAMSEHLRRHGLPHLLLERGRIAERWRSERWDSLVSNGPAWHDRFPGRKFAGVHPDAFAPRDSIVHYFEDYAAMIDAPVRCGVTVVAARRAASGGFRVETTGGVFEADNLVAATGPFQRPAIPSLVPPDAGVLQLHASAYRSPAGLPPGAVLVVGAGSSGVQIADELLRAGRRVILSVGPHNRPPRSYRGRDVVWWLDRLGKWDTVSCEPGREHISIAVSGARGGHTVDFRDMAARGVVLAGRTRAFHDGAVHFAPDLAENLARGDADYLGMLDDADAYAARAGLDLPDDPGARALGAAPCAEPPASLHLAEAGVAAIVWATGYTLDFGWLEAGGLAGPGRPAHERGVSPVPGLYFLGLPWLSCRASAFIWGVWRDAGFLADHIAARAGGPAGVDPGTARGYSRATDAPGP